MANNQKLQFTIEGEDRSGKAVKSFKGNVDSASKSMGQGIATAAKWGAALAAAGAAAAGAAITVAATFEEKMTNVSTVLDTNVENMEAMRNEVMEIAKRTPVALDELATSLYDVRSAGISAEDAMLVLEKSAQLATAGLGTTKEAVDLSTSAINAFGLTGEDAAEAFDILMLTVKSGKTNVAELAQSFGQVAGVAKTAGVGFSELQAATAALTTTGLKASVAQNQLRAATLAIQAPTTDMAKLYKQLGVESGTALIKQKGLVGAMDAIKKAANGDVEVLKKAFGSVEALVAALSLTGEQAETFKMILEDMENPAGVLSEAFEKQQATFKASWQVLKNNLSVALVKIGSIIMPTVAKAVQNASKWFGKMLDHLEESGTLEKWGQAFATAGNIISSTFNNLVVPAFELGKVVFNGLVEVLEVLGGIFSAVADEFAQSEVIQAFFTLLKGSIGDSVTTFNKFKVDVKVAMVGIREATQGFVDWFNEYVTPVIKGVVEAVIIVIGLLVAAWESNFLGIQTITKAVFDGIKSIIEAALTIIKGILDVFVGVFTGDWERAGEGLKSIWQGVWDGIGTILGTAVVAIAAILDSLWRGIQVTFEAAGEVLSGWWGEFWTALSDTVTNVLDSMGQAIDVGVTAISTTWTATWTGLRDGFKNIWDEILKYLEKKINQAITILNKLIRGINKIPVVSIPLLEYVDINGDGANAGRRAFGGAVLPGKSYIVGERGPELFTPGVSGSITPNNELQGAGGGGGPVTVQVIVQGDVYSESTLDRITRRAKEAVQTDLVLARMGAI